MAKNETHFEFADRGATSVYKFRFEGEDTHYVWFESAGQGSLHTTPNPGPYSIHDDLGDPDHDDLDSLLAAHETSKKQWVQDLMAQFGERLAWTYP